MKNLILVTFLFLLYGCGYTAVYKDLKKPNFQIIITEMRGDKDMNNQIKNQLDRYSNIGSADKYDVAIDTTYSKIVYAKNSAGVATDYQIFVASTFTIFTNNKNHKFNFNEKINIKDQTSTFDQILYEKNIKKNFASSLREKLVYEILTLK